MFKKSSVFKIIKKFCAVPRLIPLMIIVGVTHAEQPLISSSGPFYLQGGTIPPNKGQLKVSLDSLPLDLAFKVTCDIESPNYNNPYPVVITTTGSINGVTSPSKQYLLNHQISKYAERFIIRGVPTVGGRWPMDFGFINYDDIDPVYVTNCIAIYETN